MDHAACDVAGEILDLARPRDPWVFICSRDRVP
jgi:hypothetical protein